MLVPHPAGAELGADASAADGIAGGGMGAEAEAGPAIVSTGCAAGPADEVVVALDTAGATEVTGVADAVVGAAAADAFEAEGATGADA